MAGGAPDGRSRRRVVAATCGLLILCSSAGAGGYLAGASGGADLDQSRRAGERAGTRQAERAAEREGYQEGVEDGRKAGYRATYKKAYTRAKRRAVAERRPAPVPTSAPTTAPTAPPAEAPAPAEDSLEPCTYGPDALCTPEENEREGNAERLCGPGTAEGRREAAELGIQC